jgi:hypothetical protein
MTDRRMNVAENTSDTHPGNGTDILLLGIFEKKLAETV